MKTLKEIITRRYYKKNWHDGYNKKYVHFVFISLIIMSFILNIPVTDSLSLICGLGQFIDYFYPFSLRKELNEKDFLEVIKREKERDLIDEKIKKDACL